MMTFDEFIEELRLVRMADHPDPVIRVIDKNSATVMVVTKIEEEPVNTPGEDGEEETTGMTIWIEVEEWDEG